MKNSILIIDDEPGVCESLERILSDEGMDVEIATTGEAGLRRARPGTCSDPAHSGTAASIIWTR